MVNASDPRNCELAEHNGPRPSRFAHHGSSNQKAPNDRKPKYPAQQDRRLPTRATRRVCDHDPLHEDDNIQLQERHQKHLSSLSGIDFLDHHSGFLPFPASEQAAVNDNKHTPAYLRQHIKDSILMTMSDNGITSDSNDSNDFIPWRTITVTRNSLTHLKDEKILVDTWANHQHCVTVSLLLSIT